MYAIIRYRLKNVFFLFFFCNRKVEDIDLVTGILSEAPVTNSVLGPTFLCLLGRTFRNVRLGNTKLMLKLTHMINKKLSLINILSNRFNRR